MARSNNKVPLTPKIPPAVRIDSSTANTSSLSSGVTQTTNHTVATNSTVQTPESRKKQPRDPARQRIEEQYCQPSRKRPCQRPYKKREKKHKYRQYEKQLRKYRYDTELLMQSHPHLYRIYNATTYHCRHFVRRGGAGDGIYCGNLDCGKKHERAKKLKIAKADTGKFFVLGSNIKADGGIEELSLWNKLTKRHLSATNNVLGNIKAYEPSLPYKNSHPPLNPNLFGLDSSGWSKSSDKFNASTEQKKICPTTKNNLPSIDTKCLSNDSKEKDDVVVDQRHNANVPLDEEDVVHNEFDASNAEDHDKKCQIKDVKKVDEVLVDQSENANVRCDEQDGVPNVFDASTVEDSEKSQKTADLFDLSSENDDMSKENDNENFIQDDKDSPQGSVKATHESTDTLGTLKDSKMNDSVLEESSSINKKTIMNDMSIKEVIVPSETQHPPISNVDTNDTIISLYQEKSTGEYFVSRFVGQLRDITEVERKKNKLAMGIIKANILNNLRDGVKQVNMNLREKQLCLFVDNIDKLIPIQLAFTCKGYPKKQLCFCPFKLAYVGWRRSTFTDNGVPIPDEFRSPRHNCEKPLSAEMLSLHASLYSQKDIYHEALCKYIILLFNHRNNHGHYEGLREYDPNVDISPLQLHYNEHTQFTDEELAGTLNNDDSGGDSDDEEPFENNYNGYESPDDSVNHKPINTRVSRNKNVNKVIQDDDSTEEDDTKKPKENIEDNNSKNVNNVIEYKDSSEEDDTKKPAEIVEEEDGTKKPAEIVEEEDDTKKPTEIVEENNNQSLTLEEANYNEFFAAAANYFDNGTAPSRILHKDQLKYGVTTVMSLLNIKNETPTVICNYMMENCGFNMIFGGNIVPKFETNNNPRNVLLIGIGVPNEIRKQWTNLESPMHSAYVLDDPKIIIKTPDLNSFQCYKSDVGKYVNVNKHQKTDFIRGIILEEMFSPCQVYSINNCTDELRNAPVEHVNELNININNRKLLKSMSDRNWKFDQIFIDHFRMYDSYLSTNIHKGFFINLKTLVKTDLLKIPALTGSKRPEIHIPFTPFMFAHIHGHNVDKEYDITYVVEEDLNETQTNLLYATAESDLYAYYKSIFDLQEPNHDRRITHEMKHMFEKEYLFITKAQLKAKLEAINLNICDIRFMVLTVK